MFESQKTVDSNIIKRECVKNVFFSNEKLLLDINSCYGKDVIFNQTSLENFERFPLKINGGEKTKKNENACL